MKEKQSVVFERFPNILRQLRIDKGWSQGQLAKKIGADIQRVSKYERGVACPSVDMMIKMADFFEVSLDYLIRGDKGIDVDQIKLNERLKRFIKIGQLPEEDQKTLIAVADALLKKHRFEEAAQATF